MKLKITNSNPSITSYVSNGRLIYENSNPGSFDCISNVKLIHARSNPIDIGYISRDKHYDANSNPIINHVVNEKLLPTKSVPGNIDDKSKDVNSNQSSTKYISK